MSDEAKFFYQNIQMIRIIYSMPIELLHLNLILGADLLGTGKELIGVFSPILLIKNHFIIYTTENVSRF